MNIKLILTTFIRSLFLQSLWNYERMQNVGFVFSIIPWLKQIYKNKQELYERIRVHFGFFNTHPYFANILVGITMRLEEEYLNGKTNSENVIKTKSMLAGPIAAIGDNLIWSSWRVVCSMLVISFYLCYGKDFFLNTNTILIGILIFLVVYNFVGHLPLRIFGILWGYNYSKDIVQKLAKFELQKVAKILHSIGISVIVICSFFYSLTLVDDVLLTFLFWFNILLAMILHKKFAEVIVFVVLLIFDIVLLSLLK